MIVTTNRRRVPAATVLHVAGDVDTFAADDLRDLLHRIPLDTNGAVVVDLSAVTFMSCTALSVLAEAQTRLGSRLRVGMRSRIVTRLFDITGLTSLFAAPEMVGPVPAGQDVDGGSPPRSRATVAGTWTFSRTDLERVRGLLMGVHGCDAEEAWRMLTRAAAWHGVPVGELVDLLIGGRCNTARPPPSSAAAVAALAVLMRRPHDAAAGGDPEASDAAPLAAVRFADT